MLKEHTPQRWTDVYRNMNLCGLYTQGLYKILNSRYKRQFIYVCYVRLWRVTTECVKTEILGLSLRLKFTSGPFPIFDCPCLYDFLTLKETWTGKRGPFGRSSGYFRLLLKRNWSTFEKGQKVGSLQVPFFPLLFLLSLPSLFRFVHTLSFPPRQDSIWFRSTSRKYLKISVLLKCRVNPVYHRSFTCSMLLLSCFTFSLFHHLIRNLHFLFLVDVRWH